MRTCSACGNHFPDDANFCPMDATRLPEPSAPAPVASPAAAFSPDRTLNDYVVQDVTTLVAGRYRAGGAQVETPTGRAGAAVDAQAGGAVLLQVVDTRVLPTPTVADRALRELKQLAKVKSDRVLRVLDQGRTAEGQVYVASEPAPGPSLEEVVRAQGPLPVDRARAIVLDVGEALVEAQKVGVIHRDLAPRNVLVGERAKVTGFGIAEPIDERIFGAPAFLSPEQAEGKPVDQRSNIYSLGALLYFMVTGETLFSGDTQAQVQQHLHAQPLPPSQRRPGLPAEVDKIVLKALEKSGGRRHLTLRQLLNEVDALSALVPAVAQTVIAAAPSVAVAPPMSVIGVTVMGVAPQGIASPAPAATPAPEAATPPPASTAMAASPATPAGGHDSAELDVAAAGAASFARPGDGSGVKTILGMDVAVVRGALGTPVSEPVPLDRRVERVTRRDVDATDPTLQPLGVSAPLPAPSIEDALPPDSPGPSATAAATAATLVEQAAPEEVRRVLAQMNAQASQARTPVEIAPVPQPMAAPAIAPVPSSHGSPTIQTRRPSGQVARQTPVTSGPAGKGKKAFRETGWFKKGELEEELARKAAELHSQDPLGGPVATEAVVDEANITADDRARLSLKTGRTELMVAIKPAAVPGEQMSEEDMLAEMEGGSRRGLVIGGVAIGVLALVAAIYFLFLR